jgi:hypothetical protein
VLFASSPEECRLAAIGAVHDGAGKAVRVVSINNHPVSEAVEPVRIIACHLIFVIAVDVNQLQSMRAYSVGIFAVAKRVTKNECRAPAFGKTLVRLSHNRPPSSCVPGDRDMHLLRTMPRLVSHSPWACFTRQSQQSSSNGSMRKRYSGSPPPR